MKPHLITASMAAKEALMALARFSVFGQAATLPLPPCVPMSGREGNLWCGACISPYDLEASLDYLAYHFVEPLMASLAKRIPIGAKFTELDHPTMLGGWPAANESYRDFHMRCIISEIRVDDGADPRIWRSYKRYYDVNDDKMVWGNSGIVLRFDMKFAPAPEKETGFAGTGFP